MLARQTALPFSTWGRAGSLSVATNVSVRGECGEDSWVL